MSDLPLSIPDYQAIARAHFNEPVLYTTLEVGRCIGYGEEGSDSYIVLRFPTKGGEPRIIWCSMVGGYYFLNALRDQNRVVGYTGEQWHDLWRLDADLTRAGVPKEAEFRVTLRDPHVEQDDANV